MADISYKRPILHGGTMQECMDEDEMRQNWESQGYNQRVSPIPKTVEQHTSLPGNSVNSTGGNAKPMSKGSR